jgi:hypothetical protein
MLGNILKRGLFHTNPAIFLPRYASTSGQQTVLVVLYEGLIINEYFFFCKFGILFLGGEAGKKNKKILGCVENALGLREWIKENKLEDRLKLVVTSDKQGEKSLAEKTLPEASVVISQPFWPCYLDQTRIDKAKKLKLAITAGVGSDHVNLEAACKRGKLPFI